MVLVVAINVWSLSGDPNGPSPRIPIELVETVGCGSWCCAPSPFRWFHSRSWCRRCRRCLVNVEQTADGEPEMIHR